MPKIIESAERSTWFLHISHIFNMKIEILSLNQMLSRFKMSNTLQLQKADLMISHFDVSPSPYIINYSRVSIIQHVVVVLVQYIPNYIFVALQIIFLK